MPAVTKVTCDVCGAEGATQYPSCFDIINEAQGRIVAEPGGLAWMAAPRKLVASWKGILRYGCSVCLCKTHFESLQATIAAWLEGQLVPAGQSTSGGESDG